MKKYTLLFTLFICAFVSAQQETIKISIPSPTQISTELSKLTGSDRIDSKAINLTVTKTEYDAAPDKSIYEGRTVVDATGSPVEIEVADGSVTNSKLSSDISTKIRSIEVSPEDFGALGDGVTDDSDAIQAACNSGANNIKFKEDKIYRFSNVYLPSYGLTIDLNGSTIKPVSSKLGSTSPNFFNLFPLRNSISTGLYTGVTQSATSSNKKTIKKIVIKNGNIDGEYSAVSLFLVLGSGNVYTFFDGVDVLNCKAKNVTKNGFVSIYSDVKITDNSFKVKEVNVIGNEFRSFGENIRNVVNDNYPIGSKDISIRSLDESQPINKKMYAGMYIQFGTDDTIKTSSGGTLSFVDGLASASYYKINNVNIDTEDDLKATINIQSGTFNTSTGFTPDNTNNGLATPIIKNAYIYPPDNYTSSILLNLPQFSTNSGSTILTMPSQTTTQIIKFNNLYVGQSVFFSNMLGQFKINSIDNINYTVTLNNTTPSTTTLSTLLYAGTAGNGVFTSGLINRLNVNNNTLIGGDHLLRETGSRGAEYVRQRDIPSKVVFSNNYISHTWMGYESQSVSTVNQPFGFFDPISFVEDETEITIPNSSNYSVTTLSGEKYLHLSTESSPTANNSLMEGDLIDFLYLKGIYKIENIPSDFSSNPIITFVRFNTDTKVESGGFLNSASSTGEFGRVYSIKEGTKSAVGNIELNNNRFFAGIRNSSSSYFASLGGGYVHVKNNELNLVEGTGLEISSESLIIENNIFRGRLWRGEAEGTGHSVSSGKGAGKLGAFLAGSFVLKDNIIDFEQSTEAFNQSGAHSIANDEQVLVADKTYFKIQNNIYTSLYAYVNLTTIAQPEVVWNEYEISGNTFNFKGVSTYYVPFLILGEKTLVKGNIFNSSTRFSAFFKSGTLAPEFNLDLSIKAESNTFSVPVVWGANVYDFDEDIIFNKLPPVSSSEDGIEGEVRYDANYVYRYSGSAWTRTPVTFTTW